MDIEKYIKESSSKIRNKKKRELFKQELRDHILDRVEFYTDSGYDKQTAVKKALEHMGEAENISSAIGKIHNSSLVFNIVFSLCLATLFPLIWGFNFFYLQGDFSGNINYVLAFEEILIFGFIPLIMPIFSRKRSLLCVNELYAVGIIYIIYRVLTKQFYSVLVFSFYTIITGKVELLSLIYNETTELSNTPLLVVSVIFVVLIEFFEVMIILSQGSHRTVKELKIIKIMYKAISLIAVFVLSVGITIPFMSDYHKDYYTVTFAFSENEIDSQNLNWDSVRSFDICYPFNIFNTAESYENIIIKEEKRITVKTDITGLTYRIKLVEIIYNGDYKSLAVCPNYSALGTGIFLDGQTTERDEKNIQYYNLSDGKKTEGGITGKTPQFRFIVSKSK